MTQSGSDLAKAFDSKTSQRGQVLDSWSRNTFQFLMSPNTINYTGLLSTDSLPDSIVVTGAGTVFYNLFLGVFNKYTYVLGIIKNLSIISNPNRYMF